MKGNFQVRFLEGGEEATPSLLLGTLSIPLHTRHHISRLASNVKRPIPSSLQNADAKGVR